ncbi:MAG: FCD domain-containing protein [Desulfobacterales bacterium]|nr:FCD domain-containing protein [Desulfobacterales bacterium]
MEDFDKIRRILTTRPRDLLLFELIIQTKMPVKNLLELKIRDVKGLRTGDRIPLPHAPEDEADLPIVTPEMDAAFHSLLQNKKGIQANDYLFKSRKGNGPLSVPSVSRIIRSWREETGLTQYGGVPGLRQARQKDLDSARKRTAGKTEERILPKVQSRTVQEIVYHELESAILSGRIPPGQKIVTEEIARMMDVSRIPVREAMGRLEAKGLISTKPKWGSLVKELSRENLKEISEMRILLEPRAAAKATRKVSPEFIIQLDKAQTDFARARKGTKTSELLETNRNFHFLIYRQAGAPILLEVIKHLWDKVSPYYHIMFGQSLDKAPKVGVSYHEHIVESLKNRDEEKVLHWLKADLIDSTDYILELFDNQNS